MPNISITAAIKEQRLHASKEVKLFSKFKIQNSVPSPAEWDKGGTPNLLAVISTLRFLIFVCLPLDLSAAQLFHYFWSVDVILL